MRRDFDLIRLLLLDAEGIEPVDLSAYSDDEKKYHWALLIDAGFVSGKAHYSRRSGTAIPDMVVVHRLLWPGHEFLDKIRSEGVWSRAKAFVTEKGLDLSLDAIKTSVGIVIHRMMS
jgi:hypothetical protein